ncbi:diaminopimelate epimerase [Kamptonema cortianum]|nr:diaminopimelate epimerase [Oscillatoria laete-virens]MDK3160268.1 diaminopimelate epimerase [Kamptonema cortianum]MDL5048381.1 diaminopimelate epimerase [Oscillatoria amoena NRMC-F 0135]MDL5054254.1 diaminopimelate epimerase [Oscillatoria laete-virens NRMC-F 0139]
MKIPFVKMNGAGNDFVMIDNRDLSRNLSHAQIARLCDRHRGVGADGLLAVEPSQQGGDYRFRYYNSDGGEAEMCGNGARCFARFAQKISGGADKLSFETIAGMIHAVFDGDLVRLNLSNPQGLELNKTIALSDGQFAIHNCNTGVPHAVLIVDDADKAYVGRHGAEIRYHADYAPKGTNVNFVQKLGGDTIRVRTYERGVEGETLACGTGVTAAAIVASRVLGVSAPVKVRVQGGDTLEVDFKVQADGGVTDVFLKGPADFVFSGEIEI